VIKIAISQAAFEAIAAALLLGSVGYENEINERGERLIWLDHGVVSRLRAMRGRGESYSGVILRLVEETSATSCKIKRPLKAGAELLISLTTRSA
jgi:hypothetical protein